ncbi:hypothetical protein SLEP1_g39302 [Rubroshorea leprosula]|uniref:Uncharacterized protein n=1 Tax=Rubroshorea leprosula TaxID=152421 RepID=A0AAV5L068_9ROSI|nr:hypothetical protein SLEP1_g39302 [Rubroshorea leprosula]
MLMKFHETTCVTAPNRKSSFSPYLHPALTCKAPRWILGDEVEEVEKLVREEGDVVDILYLTSPQAIEAAELYGPSSLSEAEMDEFTNAAGGLRIPKKPRKKLTTSVAANRGVPERERLPSTSARAVGVQPRPEPVMGGSEDVKINLEDREREEAVVRGLGRGKGPFPQPSFQKSLFEATNTTGAKHFLNATLPEGDRMQAKDEVISHMGYTVVRHALESASWTNALAQEYAESVRDRASLQRQCDDRAPERDDVLSTKLVLEERKRKICEEKLEAQDKYMDNMRKGAAELKKNVNLLVHNGMEEHIGNFLNSSTFEDILKLYRLPTAIVAFTDCRKKVKAQYPEVDVTTITFGEQKEGVEEDGESLCVDFRPQITLRWERDAEGRTIFPPAFDSELVAVEGEEEEEEEEEGEAQGTGVEDQVALAEVQPLEVHPVSSDEVQALAPLEAEVPPLPAGDEPPPLPPPAEEQPPPLAD